METYIMYENLERTRAFQKDLIVWKLRIRISMLFKHMQVSEGLNSVETVWQYGGNSKWIIVSEGLNSVETL